MFRLSSVALLLALVVSSFAQMMPMGLTGKMMLVAMPEVKKELKITKEQDKKIKETIEQFRTDPTLTKTLPDMHYTTREMDKKVVEHLDEAQRARLLELFIQENGYICLTEKEVSEPLALPKETQEKAEEIIDKLMSDVMASLMESQKEGKIDMKAIDGFKKQAQADIKALMSPEQEERWKAMQGKPFKFPKLLGKR